MTKDAPPPYSAAQAGESSASPFSVSLNGSTSTHLNTLLVTVTPPAAPSTNAEKKEKYKRAPVDLCAVIDVSGSMGDDASPPAEEGNKKEDTGLSVLDVVKHAMKTIIATMQDDDRLAIVAFTNEAQVVSKFQATTEKGKEDLMKSVEKLVPLGSTNLWDGLKKGMELFNEIQSSSSSNFARNSSIFLLTDGMPNVEPPRGHIPMLQQYLESNPRSHFTISTFGFGYHLNSDLLCSIAVVGGGGSSFIPDSGMVGTVFVHAVANLYATYATRCEMNVELPEGVTLKRPRGDFPYVSVSWGAKVYFGSLQYGQTRDIILEFDGIKPQTEQQITISVVAKPWFTQTFSTVTAVQASSDAPSPVSDLHKYHVFRLDLVSTMFAVATKDPSTNQHSTEQPKIGEGLKNRYKKFQQDIKDTLPECPEAIALAQDIGGEVTLAVSDIKNWNKWGVHYFPSLARSHQMQQCSNFKDAGLQIYGQNSPLFTTSRDEVDAAFDRLPAPKPSIKARAGVARTVHKNMSAWNSRAGPCFAAECEVLMPGGRKVNIDKLSRGMQIVTPAGDREVVAVLKTKVMTGMREMCQIGELKVTPWHPIFYNGKWCFPAEVSKPYLMNCDYVYSILLSPHQSTDAHAITVGGVVAVTLGHGLEEDGQDDRDIRTHSFFGSYARVLQSLSNLPGFYEDEGIAECMDVVRGIDGRICDFIGPKEAGQCWYNCSAIPDVPRVSLQV